MSGTRWLGFVVGAAGFAVIAFHGCRPGQQSNFDVVCSDTPGWGTTGELRMRRESESSEALLFQFRRPVQDRVGDAAASEQVVPTIYRHRPGQPELDVVTPEDWTRAGGAISDCRQLSIASSPRFRADFGDDFQLRFDRRLVPIAGKGLVKTSVSPDNELAAVVSSAVAQTRGMILHGRPSGQFYHQFFRMRDAAQVGATWRLPRLSDGRDEILHTCWSTDSRYMIYVDDHHSRLCVVEAPQRGTE